VVTGVRHVNKLTHIGPVSIWMADHLWADVPSWYVKSQLPLGSLNQVPALAGVKVGMSPLSGGR